MKLAFSNRAIDGLPVEDFLTIALSCGCDGVELYQSALNRERRSPERHFETIGSEAEKMGLEVAAICVSASLADPLLMEDEIARVCEVIRAAPKARTRLVEVTVGRPSSLQARHSNWITCSYALQRCVWVADRRQVGLAVKIHFSTLADTLAGSVRLLDQVDRAQLGVALDARHLRLSNDDPGTAISIYSGRIKFACVQEVGPPKAPFDYLPIGEGESSAQEVVASLLRHGYRGYLCLLFEGLSGKQFAEAARRDAERVKDFILRAAQIAPA
jgi:sugar phosphate isomerase/epimerase